MAREYKLPEVLKDLCKKKGISQNKLAFQMGASQRSVYDWTNCRSYPSLFTLMDLAERFEVSLDYLVYGEGAAVEETKH